MNSTSQLGKRVIGIAGIGDRLALESVIDITGIGDRLAPDSVIGFGRIQ